MKNSIKTIILALVFGAISAMIVSSLSKPSQQEIENAKIFDYYNNAAATLVSPHSIRERMRHGEEDSFILVDTRAAKDYLTEHVTTSINIDSSQTPEKIISDFKNLEKEGKEIIIYCYSSSCMNGRKLGALLSQNDIFVKEMTIGWTEWRFYPNTWNYPDEWDSVDIMDYVTSGLLPGELDLPDAEKEKEGCGVTGDLGC